MPAGLISGSGPIERNETSRSSPAEGRNNLAIHIGTSGWHYKHWLGDFYPERYAPDKMFSWYAREFHTVEINNSFYRLPEQKIFQRWKDLAPPGFIFAVKASRFITHIKRLKDAQDAVDLLFSRARRLGSTLGPVLFQLPPRWKANVERLAEFLSILPKRHRFALEFRDESWYRPPVYELLRLHNVAICLHDWQEIRSPKQLTANFTYIRFHGSGSRYGGNYPVACLREWADKIRSWQEELREVFVYFNNDIGGHAIRNARSLRAMLGSRAQPAIKSGGKSGQDFLQCRRSA
jgi:uncharacterized protein YecE (DUF72 family)